MIVVDAHGRQRAYSDHCEAPRFVVGLSRTVHLWQVHSDLPVPRRGQLCQCRLIRWGDIVDGREIVAELRLNRELTKEEWARLDQAVATIASDAEKGERKGRTFLLGI